ncbi:unnamed protein product [Brassica oleracea]
MNLRRHKVPESPQTIRRRSSLLTCDELLLKFPIDLVIEIFSRLPLKSIDRCRCVSKRWSHLSLQIWVRISVNGFFCISDDDRILEGTKTSELVSVICNPSTKQSFPLPKVKTRKWTAMRSFLGFDPVEKQYNVLSVTISVKYSFVKSMERGMSFETLINFQGKFVISGTSTSFEMCILEDPEKHEWSKRIFNLPPTWTDASATNEFVVFKTFLFIRTFLCSLSYNES